MPDFPNCFVVGAAKAGTTALYHYFRAHPEIYVPGNIKEPNYMAFFAGIPNFAGPGDKDHASWKSITNVADYQNLYRLRCGEAIAADVSPAYLYYPQAAAKIAELCAQAKIIIVLRNPIESAFSMFSMMYRDRREACNSFREAFSRTPDRMADGWEWAWDYQGTFRYAQQVARYLTVFPRSQLFIRRYEELKNTPKQFYADLTQFLGVRSIQLEGANRRVNESARRSDRLKRSRSGKLLVEVVRVARQVVPTVLHDRFNLNALNQPAFRPSDEDRQMLADYFRDDIRTTGSMLDWNLESWLNVDDRSKSTGQSAVSSALAAG